MPTDLLAVEMPYSCRNGHGVPPEHVGIHHRNGDLDTCGHRATFAGRDWVCVAAAHDQTPGTSYGRADSHRFRPA